jgi:hypothetical protein
MMNRESSAEEREAYEIGRRHGSDAWSWHEQYTTADGARRAIDGIDDGDPEVLDLLPRADLSGEMADGYSMRDLEDDLGLDDENDPDGLIAQECADAYELGFDHGVEEAIREQAQSGRDGGRT